MSARRKTALRETPVPEGRLSRLLAVGLMTGEIVAGVLAEGVKRFATSPPNTKPGLGVSRRSATRLVERLSHLRGAAMKLGQLLSLERGSVLPPELAEALAILRAGAHAMPQEQLRRVLAREWGARWEARFDEFDFAPLAAASIGQVHHARTRDGRELAIKVQYPGVARSIDGDVDNVAVVLRLFKFLPLGLDVAGLVAEAKRQLHREADYLAEARHLARYRRLLTGEPRLAVPRVHSDLTTKHVLAMDFCEGEPLDALAGADIAQSERDAVGRLLESLLFRELFEFRFMQTDPNFANYLYDRKSRRIMLLDFGSVREFSARFVELYRHITAAIIAGDRKTVRKLGCEIGYFAPDAADDVAEAAVDVMMLVCEPLRHRGAYDFAASDLSTRARSLSFDLAFRQGLLRAPPAETLFLHRKLAGAFLLCARIGARVNVRKLVSKYL